ncbi:MAG: heavy metal translocating P-type ATPase metal-binding domain-containing protein [Ferruginibacter sp.]
MQCYHCGDNCSDEDIVLNDKHFCCEGCKQVFLLLNENDLCVYYDIDQNPGIKAKGKFISDRFAYLDDDEVQQKLVQFSSATQINIVFSLPQMHCSSCIFLLENLHRIDAGIIRSQTNFQRKEVFIVFDPQKISLRKVVELLAFIGYEPSISLKDTVEKKSNGFNRQRIYKIGIAGFCFANIMMLSFPEYFSSGHIEQKGLKETFTWLNLFLSLPVLLYSASGFFIAAWKGIRQKFLNIDAPIALAILVTYARSYYEIISGRGAGYLDSGTGIVFFMLIGRWFQDKTYDSFSFDRDYLSYFPLGVSVVKNGTEKSIPVTQLQKGDRIIIRHGEMIPADSVLLNGAANIDYSFVSGENIPVQKQEGDLLYAGGKQMGGAIELRVAGAASQSYITQLWNNDVFHNKKNKERSFIHPWSRYFTLALFTVAIGTLIFWWINDPAKILPAVSSVLIVACPCSLLLSATFTYGNMLRIFGKNKMYLKNAAVIESLAKIDTIVFDKTGTITQNHAAGISYKGTMLSGKEQAVVQTAAAQSSHPLSKMIAAWLQVKSSNKVQAFKEHTGKGLHATIDGMDIKMGAADFMDNDNAVHDTGTHVHVMLNNVYKGKFGINNKYRDGITKLIQNLDRRNFKMAVLSGDNAAEKNNLQQLFGNNVPLLFNRSPQQKLEYIQKLQLRQHNNKNSKVLMLGDGLNDAGALMQSDVGIAVSDNAAQFSPACDAILEGEKLCLLDQFIAYARSGKKIVTASFILSVLYNIVGLSFAVQGLLSPMVAAILMPASSISIVLLVTLCSGISARLKGFN